MPWIRPGAVLLGRYRLERIVGEGAMGVVVAATHLHADRPVALKFLLPAFGKRRALHARFAREARAATRIKSEHVARVLDVEALESGEPFIVMELLTGEDLGQRLERLGPLPADDAVDYVVQACDALAQAHALGIIHRDLKPANLYLDQLADGTSIVKVLDFGLSKWIGGEDLTKSSSTVGSAAYMSPEQLKSSATVDRRTDVYALGVTLFELLAGRQPFAAETAAAMCLAVLFGEPVSLATLRPDLPPGLVAAVHRALMRDRDARFADVAELVRALSPFAPARSAAVVARIAGDGARSSAAPAGAAPSSDDELPFAPTEVAAAIDAGAGNPPPIAPESTAVPVAREIDPAADGRRATRSRSPALVALLLAVAVGAVVVWFVRARAGAGEPTAAPSASGGATALPLVADLSPMGEGAAPPPETAAAVRAPAPEPVAARGAPTAAPAPSRAPDAAGPPPAVTTAAPAAPPAATAAPTAQAASKPTPPPTAKPAAAPTGASPSIFEGRQ